MRQRAGSVMRLATPVKVLVQRFAYLLLITSAAGIILLGKLDSVVVEDAKMAVTDAFAPVLVALSRPIATVNGVVEELRELARLRVEIERLREENARLARWQATARQLNVENEAFRELLKMSPAPATRAVSARVIADTGGAFVRSVLVDVGARDGVEKGQAAMSGQGLVGRVAAVGGRSARILLVTDLNSRIPVVLESTRYRAVLAGDNSDRPLLLYLPAEAHVSIGDRVMTSGHGGVFPPGLVIGAIVSTAEGGPRVLPFADWDRLSHLSLLGVTRVRAPSAPIDAGHGQAE